jgi:hypothetical protein
MDAKPPRSYPRYPVHGVYATLRSPSDVRLLNLSRVGMAIETSRSLTVGDSYFLELRSRQGSVHVEAQVRWCQMCNAWYEEARPLFRAGLSFREIESGAGLWSRLRPHPVLS